MFTLNVKIIAFISVKIEEMSQSTKLDALNCDILLTVHLSIILVINQLNAQTLVLL